MISRNKDIPRPFRLDNRSLFAGEARVCGRSPTMSEKEQEVKETTSGSSDDAKDTPDPESIMGVVDLSRQILEAYQVGLMWLDDDESVSASILAPSHR